MWKLYKILRNLPEVMYPELMNLSEDVRRQVLKGGTRHSGIFPWRYWGVCTPPCQLGAHGVELRWIVSALTAASQ